MADPLESPARSSDLPGLDSQVVARLDQVWDLWARLGYVSCLGLSECWMGQVKSKEEGLPRWSSG